MINQLRPRRGLLRSAAEGPDESSSRAGETAGWSGGVEASLVESRGGRLFDGGGRISANPRPGLWPELEDLHRPLAFSALENQVVAETLDEPLAET